MEASWGKIDCVIFIRLPLRKRPMCDLSPAPVNSESLLWHLSGTVMSHWCNTLSLSGSQGRVHLQEVFAAFKGGWRVRKCRPRAQRWEIEWMGLQWGGGGRGDF